MNPHLALRAVKRPGALAKLLPGILVPLALLAAALPGPARAEPRFAARTGLPCAVCHVNPTGAGMRTAYARDVFEKQQLTLWRGAGKQLGLDFDPRIGDVVAIGSDLRFASIWQPSRQEDDPPLPPQTIFFQTPTRFTFFPMQTDLYTSAELGRYTVFYADIGWQGSAELFGMIRNLPLGLYLKAGFFTPPYGTKIPNHTAAHRQHIGFDPRSKDAGVEIGITQPWLDAQAAIQNGNFDNPLDTNQNTLSLRNRPALSARGQLIGSFKGLKLMPGGSIRCVGADADVTDQAGDTRTLTGVECQEGGFLWASLGRFTNLFEIDYHVRDDVTQLTSEGKPSRVGQRVIYEELSFWPIRGLDLGLTYETMDRDIYSSGDVIHRFGFQGQLFPVPYTEVMWLLRNYQARKDQPEDDQWELIVFLHLFF